MPQGPILIQELSGSTLFKLCTETINFETLQIWESVNVIVLTCMVHFSRDGLLEYSVREQLHSGETYMDVLKKLRSRHDFKIIIEVKDYFVHHQQSYGVQWLQVLNAIEKFCRNENLNGFKIHFSEKTTLTREIIWAFEEVLNRQGCKLFTLLEFQESMLQCSGFIHRLVSICDFTLFPMQGYFEHIHNAAIYGYVHKKLANQNDRYIKKCEAHLHRWVTLGLPRGKLLANFACSATGMIMDSVEKNTVVQLLEISRADIYHRLGAEASQLNEFTQWMAGLECNIYYDNQASINAKLHLFLGSHLLAGVYIQDFGDDIMFIDSRSVFGTVNGYIQDLLKTVESNFGPPWASPSQQQNRQHRRRNRQMVENVRVHEPRSIETDETLQVQTPGRMSSNTPSTELSLASLEL